MEGIRNSVRWVVIIVSGLNRWRAGRKTRVGATEFQCSQTVYSIHGARVYNEIPL